MKLYTDGLKAGTRGEAFLVTNLGSGHPLWTPKCTEIYMELQPGIFEILLRIKMSANGEFG